MNIYGPSRSRRQISSRRGSGRRGWSIGRHSRRRVPSIAPCGAHCRPHFRHQMCSRHQTCSPHQMCFRHQMCSPHQTCSRHQMCRRRHRSGTLLRHRPIPQWHILLRQCCCRRCHRRRRRRHRPIQRSRLSWFHPRQCRSWRPSFASGGTGDRLQSSSREHGSSSAGSSVIAPLVITVSDAPLMDTRRTQQN